MDGTDISAGIAPGRVAPGDDDELRGHSDPQLVIGIGRRQRAALGEVHRRHGGQLHDIATRMRAPRDADGIVAQVLLALWRDPTGFDPRRTSLRSFLVRQTVLAARPARSGGPRLARRSTVRQRRAAPNPHLEAALAARVGPDAWQRLAVLPDDDRTLLALSYWCGYTPDELAGLLGTPPELCKARIRTGLLLLAGRNDPDAS